MESLLSQSFGIKPTFFEQQKWFESKKLVMYSWNNSKKNYKNKLIIAIIAGIA
jgi:hypothetical protein